MLAMKIHGYRSMAPEPGLRCPVWMLVADLFLNFYFLPLIHFKEAEMYAWSWGNSWQQLIQDSTTYTQASQIPF